MNTQNAPSPVSFEDCLKELEDTVERLEAGELPLEESLVLFEKGVGSLKRCHAILDQADKRVRMLVKSANGAVVLEDVGTAVPASAAANAPARKKSAKQSIDLEPAPRQNDASLPNSQPEARHDDSGPGGSLFGVSK